LRALSSSAFKVRELLLPMSLVEILRAMKDNLSAFYFLGRIKALTFSTIQVISKRIGDER